MSDRVCGKRMWSYEHWACQRPARHWGRHRFNNYTGTRIPHLWEVRQMLRVFKTNRRLRSYTKPGEVTQPRLFRYRQVLFPNRFDPIPVTGLRPKEPTEVGEGEQ